MVEGLAKLLGFGAEIEPSLETWLTMVHPGDRPRVLATIHAGLEHAGDVLDRHGLAGEELQLLEKPFDRNRLLSGVRAAL